MSPVAVLLALALPLGAPSVATATATPAVEHEVSVSSRTASALRPSSFLVDCPASTGRSATILLPSNAAVMQPGGPLEPGDEIAVVRADGGCAGAGTWGPDGLALTVWADDPFTPETEGLVPGAPLQFMVRDASSGTIYQPDEVEVAYLPDYDAAGGFHVDDLYLVAQYNPVASTTGASAPLELGQNFPNPVRAQTTLPFSLDAAGPATLDVYDALGRHVTRLAEGEHTAGTHTAALDASGLASGVYVYRLQAGEALLQRRFVVAR